jgi:hypothetical protein
MSSALNAHAWQHLVNGDVEDRPFFRKVKVVDDEEAALAKVRAKSGRSSSLGYQ